ncbi:MAG: hypothetical protein J7M03_04150 [Candidatus Desulfofervidaceae bacterium]|nr:hypothetical protein [Candidatus Desulfofervidaceae bacterium]
MKIIRVQVNSEDLDKISESAEKPVYISITNTQTQIKDATNLWGKTTAEVEKIIKEKEGKGTRVVSIGVAGENRNPEQKHCQR